MGDNIMKDMAFLRDFITRTRELVGSRHKRLNLEPRVLAHFNDWAQRTISPLFQQGYGFSLQPSTIATYCADRNGFEIELGRLQRDGRDFFGDFFDDDIYEAIEQYEEETPWVYNVETHFDLPN